MKTILNLIKESEASLFCDQLDALEQIPILFGQNSKQIINYHSILQNAKEILKKNKSNDLRIKQRIAALMYRLESINGGWNPGMTSFQTLVNLKEEAEKWIQKNPILGPTQKERIEKINEAGSYHALVYLILENESLKKAFFEWVIRDGNPISIFAQYPSLQEKIVSSNLHIRIGYFGGNILKIEKLGIKNTPFTKKIVMLPFEGNLHNILNPDEVVTFKEGAAFKMEEIFNLFKRKSAHAVALEFMAEGIIHWNTFEWKIDLDKEDWWRQLPLFETLTLQEAKKRYSDSLDGKKWGIAARATRSSLDLQLLGNHAFFEIAIPAENCRSYTIFPIGKYAKEVPFNLTPIQGISYLCDMSPATLSYVDENVFYTFREHSFHFFPVSSTDGKKLMNHIKRDYLEGVRGNLRYQIETENCAKWVQELLTEILGEKVPNLFKMHFLQADAGGPIGYMMKLIRKLPNSCQTWILTRAHLVLGAYKGAWIEKNGIKHWISLTTVTFWENGMIYFPPHLPHQKAKGQLLPC